MIHQERNLKAIFDQSLNRLENKINLFTSEILREFRTCYLEFNQSSRQKQEEYIRVIEQQKQIAKGMEKFIQFAKNCEKMFMNKSSSSLNSFSNTFVGGNTVDKIPDQIIEQKASLKHQPCQHKLIQQNPKLNKNNLKQQGQQDNYQQNIQLENQQESQQEQQEQSLSQQSSAKYQQKDNYLQKKQRKLLKNNSNQIIKKQKSTKKAILKNDQMKLPLRCSRNHKLQRRTYKINQTKISYVYYTYTKSNIFTEKQVQTFKKYDLDQVQGIEIRYTTLSSNVLNILGQLNWKNIIQLDLVNNKILDIRPIRHFNLEQLVDMTITNNPLNQSSAQFLATERFPSLVYFALSFEQQNTDSNWKIVIKNKMLNYPKMQQFFIQKQHQISEPIKLEILTCIQELQKYQKSQRQQELSHQIDFKSQHINKSKNQPSDHQNQSDYKINAIWLKQWNNISSIQSQQQQQLLADWRKDVRLKITELKRQDANEMRKKLMRKQFKKQMQDFNQSISVNKKTKIIKKKTLKKSQNSYKDKPNKRGNQNKQD